MYNMNMFKKIIACGIAGLVLTISSVSAQEIVPKKNVFTLEMGDSLGSWRNSRNAAGLSWDKPMAFSRIQMDYALEDGNFKRPEAPMRSNSQGVYAIGNTDIKDSYIQGFLSYNRHKREDASFNASLIDPTRDMPYRVLDSNASDWINQHYKMGFDWTSRVFRDRWSVGVGMNYEASSGAKQRDIRANISSYALEISPGVVYALTSRQRIGAHISYRNRKEESENSNVNVYVDQGYYLHYGLGHAVPYVGSGTNLNYKGDTWGAGLQYEAKGDWDLFVSSAYGIGAERVTMGLLENRSEGLLLKKDISTEVRAKRITGRHVHRVTLAHRWKSTVGTEFWNEFVSGLESEGYVNRYRANRSRYGGQQWKTSYLWMDATAWGYRWKIDATVAYEKENDRYILPESRMNIAHVDYGIGLSRAFSWSRSVCAIGAKVWRKQNLTADYSYGGNTPDEWPVTELMQGDLRYLGASYWRVDVPLTYTFALPKGSQQELYIRGNLFWIDLARDGFTNRKGGELALGMTF